MNGRALAVATGLLVARALPASAETPAQHCIAAAESTQRGVREGKLLASRSDATTCAASACPDVVRADCQRWLDELATQIPTLVVTARDASGHDVVRAELAVDGRPVAATLDGRPIELDPGPHEVRLRVGESVTTETIVLASGEKQRQLRLAIAAPPVARAPVNVPLWIAVGATAAAGGLAAGFGVAAVAKHSSLEGSCGHACSHSQVAPGERYALVADVALGAAVVAAGLGVWFFFHPPGRRAPTTALLSF